jgi:acetyl coenzyme A synthetase (ADP forming)-like protein
MRERDLSEYLEPVVLRDGGSLLIRAIHPDDKPRLADHFARLGVESVRHRFFGGKRELTAKELAYYTEVDFTSHVGLVATTLERGEERILGVGRYCTIGRHAEVAFAVADAHQGRGIGTVLLEHLTRIARLRGIEALEADVLVDNEAMLDVFTASGFVVRASQEHDVIHVVFPIAPTEASAAAELDRDRRASAASVRVFFEPRSVAVIGASRREGSIGRAILANLRRAKFPRPIYAVNPAAAARGESIDGVACVRSVGAAGGPVDLAIVCVPAPAVEDVIAECAHAGVRGAVVITSGFAEVSPAGRAAQDRLLTLARGAGMRLVGPNCMGVLDTRSDGPLDATFAPTWPPAGNVAMVSQSGALGIAMLDHAAALNLGISSFVSVGNKADVSSNDLLAYWAGDPRTQVIALYLESFGNPRRFARIAPAVARHKPIVAIKSGRSAAGTRAATSHSAALASLDVGVDALFAQAGVVRTATMEELFDVVALLATQPVPAGPRVGVVTNAGGPGILLADACEAHGLVLPALADETCARLRALLPAAASIGNPVDMTASAPPDHFARAIELVGNDPNVDALVAIYIPPMVTDPHEIAAAIARGAGAVSATRPIATVFMSSRGAPEALSTGPRGRIPSYSFPENAALALAAAARYGRWRARPRGHAHVLDREPAREIRAIVERVLDGATAPRWASMPDVARILALAGIAVAPFEVTAPSGDAAVAAADRLGYPVVAKAIAPGLIHKSDVGGVIVELEDAAAVRDAVDALATRLGAAGHAIEQVMIQHQVVGGIEALVGVTTDPSLGPLIVAGLGGVAVELLRDVAFRLTPVTDVDAREMLGELRGARLLDGFRGAPPADRAALEDTILRLSALVELVPELTDLELNPLRVLARGAGAIAVDARLRLAP